MRQHVLVVLMPKPPPICCRCVIKESNDHLQAPSLDRNAFEVVTWDGGRILGGVLAPEVVGGGLPTEKVVEAIGKA
jgi:hypothetical protein